jgi:hypothetical protein
MKARTLVSASALTSAASMALLLACASDESASLTDPASRSVVPSFDSGPDAAADDAEAGEEADPCTPDALCPNGPFDPNATGGALDVRARINVIRGRSANDVWAVGAHGAAAHFDGTSWTRSETGTIETFKGLWLRDDAAEVAMVSLFSASTRGLTAGGDGDAAPPSAGGWSDGVTPSTPPEAEAHSRRFTSAWTAPGAEWLWCTTMESVPYVGSQFVNGLWRLRVAPSTNALEVGAVAPAGACDVLPCGQMMSIHGASPNDLWAVGFTGAAIHVTDAQSDTPKLKAFDSQTWSALNGVWAASASEAWAVGGGGVIRHYTGAPDSWDIVPDVPTAETLNAVWGSSSTDVWAVGDAGVVLHYDGNVWSLVKVGGLGGRRPNLYAVWTSAPGHVWIGGHGVLLSPGGKS